MKTSTVIIIIILFIISFQGYGQCAENFPESFYEAARNAPIIVEGRMIPNTVQIFGRNAYDDFLGDSHDTHDRYVAYIVEVYKVLKGDFEAERIEIIKDHGLAIRGVKHGKSMGEPIGIYLLYPNDIKEATPHTEIPSHLKFKFKAPWTCNHIGYNSGITYTKELITKSLYDFESFKDIKTKIYDPVKKMTGKNYCEIKKWEKKSFFFTNLDANVSEKSSQSVPSISSFFPTTIPAGTFDTLTIIGSNFGNNYTEEIAIELYNADDGGTTTFLLYKNHIIQSEWTDTLIRVLVPSCEFKSVNIDGNNATDIQVAGTGTIILSQNGTPVDTSTQILTIPYAEYTYALTDSTQVYPTRLTQNSGYNTFTFMVTPEFRSDTISMQLLEQALEVWRCETGVNFVIDCNTTNHPSCDPFDNKSVVTYKSATCYASHLNSPTLATTLRRFRLCADSSTYFLRSVDIVFNDTVLVGGTIPGSWYYHGNAVAITPIQHDFLTTAIHELGHAHLIEHIIDNTQLMNYVYESGLGGVLHTLNPFNDVVAGQNVMSRSTPDVTVNCYGGMIPVAPDSCALPTCYINDCFAPDYPLYANFTIIPEECLDDPTWTPATDWELSIGQYVPLVFQNTSSEFIDNYEWDFDGLSDLYVYRCDLSSSEDTCMVAFWDSEGSQIITLIVTDIWGCQKTFSKMINIEPIDCIIEASILANITMPQISCDVSVANCPIANETGIISFAPFAAELGSDCYSYFVEYHSACECFGLDSEALFTDNDFEYDDNGVHLSCLAEGYYQVNITDEISTCVTDTIFHLELQAPNNLIVNNYNIQETNISCNGVDACNGTVSINQVNNQPLNNNYNYAWSDCNPPESCNTPNRANLCTGNYTISVTDIITGCNGIRSFNFTGKTSIENGGTIAIDVYPVVFNDLTNVRLILDEDSEVTVDVWHISGIHKKRLIDNEFKTAGEHIEIHEANDLNSGAYIYTIKKCNEVKGGLGIKQ